MRNRKAKAAVTAAPASSPATVIPRPGRKAPAASTTTGIRGIRVICLMNARYHAAREAFLDSVHRWLLFGVIGAGASAVATLALQFADYAWLNPAFGALAAVFGALDLAFDLSNRARGHSMMKRRYFELLADVEEGQKTVAQADVCLHRYSAEEEPAYHALLMASWNVVQETVYGARIDQYVIPIRHRLLQNLWRFEGANYEFKAGNDVPSLATSGSASPSA